MTLINKAREIGIDIPVQLFNGTGEYHYYDTNTNIIMLDSNARIDLESIVHEYTHHLQITHGYSKLVIEELNNTPYSKRKHEMHAEFVATHLDEFLLDGKLNTKDILDFFDMIIENI